MLITDQVLIPGKASTSGELQDPALVEESQVANPGISAILRREPKNLLPLVKFQDVLYAWKQEGACFIGLKCSVLQSTLLNCIMASGVKPFGTFAVSHYILPVEL